MTKDAYLEGREHIPSGCAISSIFSRSGKAVCGEKIIRSIEPMHDRSNGLGGGFAGYGIYPSHKDDYAFHLFYDDAAAQKACEAYLTGLFEVVGCEKIPTRRMACITNEPIILRYFLRPIANVLRDTQLDEREYTAQAGGGMVSVTVTGKRELKALEIKPECVDPDDVEMLQDMIVAAVNEALRTAEETREAEMSKLAPGMGGMF